MHHMSSQDVSDLDAFEREHKFQSIMRIKDLYHRFFEPQLVSVRADWDNLSDDIYYLDTSADHEDWEIERAQRTRLSPLEKTAHFSFDACRRACLSSINCFQWRFRQGVCVTSLSFRHGNTMPVEARMGDKWMSGWNIDKIKQWVQNNDDCGDYPWPLI